ncbi:hypothetical protein HK096_009297, partial [Nowakowskiella sp. JEL0078]
FKYVQLKKFANYGEKALNYLKDHADENETSFANLMHKALKYLGTVYGELALEVRNSEQRSHYRSKALECLTESLQLDENSWDAAYQLALQYAEIGEIQLAIDVLNKGLTINQSHISSWNLLALLIKFDQALKVCEVGWKTCVDNIANEKQQSLWKSKGGRWDVFTWDIVESSEKEELIKFQMKQMEMENSRLGTIKALKNLQAIFGLFRKFFGNVGSDEIKTDNQNQGLRTSSESAGALLVNDKPDKETQRFASTQRHIRGLTGSSLASGSSTILPSFYRFKVYDLLICLWLTASSIYRQLNQFEDARSAVEEAEKLSETLCRLELAVKCGNRIGKSDRNFFSALHTKGRSRQPSKTRDKAKLSQPRLGLSDDISHLDKWGPVDISVRRVLADVAFEVIF